MFVRTASSTRSATVVAAMPPLTMSCTTPRMAGAPDVAVGRPLGPVPLGLGDAGLHEAGAEDGDADRPADCLEVLEERLRYGDDGLLGGVVGPEERGGDEAGDRRRVDHVALALFDQQGHEGGDAVDDAPQVDAEDPAPVLLADLPDRTTRPMPALLCTRCTAPKRSSVWSRSASHRSESETSVTTPIASAPAVASSSDGLLEGPASMSPSTIFMPSAAARSATARPMPLAPR